MVFSAVSPLGMKVKMQAGWLKQKERGSLLLIRLIGFLAQKLGRSIVRLLLYPIAFYFLLFVPKARRASKHYLRRVLGRQAGFIDGFRHVHTFSSTILDRVFLLSDRTDEFDIALYGYEQALAQYDRGKGCLLVGSHLGSFELLRNFGLKKRGVAFHALMHEANAEKMSAVLNSINPDVVNSIIPVGKSNTLLQVMEAMDKGEMVGILGDRVALDEKIVSCNFFDEPCDFPAGPMLVAGLLQVPVILFFGIYLGGNRYEIHFEVFSEGFSLQREQRMEQVQGMTQRYVERLEYYCRKFPYNWFNFYDFWKDDEEK